MPIVFRLPADEEEDEEMVNEASVPGAGVGDHVVALKKKAIKSSFRSGRGCVAGHGG